MLLTASKYNYIKISNVAYKRLLIICRKHKCIVYKYCDRSHATCASPTPQYDYT